MQPSTQQNTLKSPISRINALRAKHAMYKEEIRQAQNCPSTTDFYISQLKKEKLRLKEEIEGIRQVRQAS